MSSTSTSSTRVIPLFVRDVLGYEKVVVTIDKVELLRY